MSALLCDVLSCHKCMAQWHGGTDFQIPQVATCRLCCPLLLMLVKVHSIGFGVPDPAVCQALRNMHACSLLSLMRDQMQGTSC